MVGAGRLGTFHAQKLAERTTWNWWPSSIRLPPTASAWPGSAIRGPGRLRGLVGPLDAAVIAAPTSLHHRIARDFLQAGVHVLVEKPICATRAEADDLVAIARRRQLVLQVGHVERFNPALQPPPPVMRATEIHRGRAEQRVHLPLDRHRRGARRDDPRHRSGAVDGPQSAGKVEALGFSVLGGHEDVANARLEFDCGCVATLSASRVSYETVRRMHVWSAGGSPRRLRRPHGHAGPPERTLRRRQFRVDGLKPEEVEHTAPILPRSIYPKRGKRFDAVDALALEQDDFVESIRSGRARGPAARRPRCLAVAERILARIETTAGTQRPRGPPVRWACPRPRHSRAALCPALPGKKAG